MGFRLGRIKAPWWALALAASLVTMVLAGAVAVVATPAGCKALRLSIGTCRGNPVAGLPTPPPSQGPRPTQTPFSPTASPTSPITQTASPTLPSQPSPTAYPPYEYPPSTPTPPYALVTSGPMPSNVTLNCRLPIFVGPPGSGGFIVFPGGSFVADPRSGVTLPAGIPSPNPGQGPFQGLGLSYDRIHDRWLPVPRNLVSPDGSRYVYPGPQGVYMVNVADNSFTQLGQGKAWNILAVDSQGVYAIVVGAGGLWLLPFTGTAQQITATGYWQAVGGGAAYGTGASAVPQGATNPILRLDLKTGNAVPWFMVDGATSQVVGVDGNGSPLIVVNSSGPDFRSDLWLVPSIGGGNLIAVLSTSNYGYYQPNFNPSWPPIADAHGIWFGGGQGIYLFVPNTAWYRTSTLGAQLAGGCG